MILILSLCSILAFAAAPVCAAREYRPAKLATRPD
jgi:hypothetical protein